MGPTPALAALLVSVWLVGCHVLPEQPGSVGSVTVVPPPQMQHEPVSWSALPGWNLDDVTAAWPALVASCRAPRMGVVWSRFCAAAILINASDAGAQRTLLETQLRPYRLFTRSQDDKRERRDTGLITGYYEPVLNGSRQRMGDFQTPLYGVPDDLVSVELGDLYPALKGERIRGRLQGRRITPYPDRMQLADGKLLAGKEILWTDSAIDAFFLQIQGSGRVRLADGGTVRLAYADVNGHPYRAIGRYLVERGELTVEQATAPGLRQWLLEYPERQVEVFNHNPSVVFFREEKLGDPTVGPRGSLGVPLTAGRSLAVDPRLLPLGVPLFLATTHPVSGAVVQRLMLAQDTGGAIRGALRADLFWGLGAEAGDVAGRMRQEGSLWLLWPTGEPPPIAAP